MMTEQQQSKNLTPKQVAALPLLAASVSVRAGADECAAKHICSASTFWEWWGREDGVFKAAVVKAREEYQRAVVDHIRERAKADLEQRYDELVRCCRDGGGPNQVQAIVKAMLLAGVSEFAQGPKVSIGVSAHAAASATEEADRAHIERCRAVALARGVVDFTPPEN